MTHTVQRPSRGTRRHTRVLTATPQPSPRPAHDGRRDAEKEAIKQRQIMGQARKEDLKLLHIEVLKTTFEEAYES